MADSGSNFQCSDEETPSPTKSSPGPAPGTPPDVEKRRCPRCGTTDAYTAVSDQCNSCHPIAGQSSGAPEPAIVNDAGAEPEPEGEVVGGEDARVDDDVGNPEIAASNNAANKVEDSTEE